MRAHPAPALPPRHLAWLLWLALLLPLAQTAAAWHAVQHQAADAAESEGKTSAPHLTHCDLCLAGAAVDAGAPPSVSLVVTVDAPRPSAPAWSGVAEPDAAPRAAYRSRAPPSDLR